MDEFTKLMTAKEIAEFLKVSLPTIYLWTRTKKIKALKFGGNGSALRYDPQDLFYKNENKNASSDVQNN